MPARIASRDAVHGRLRTLVEHTGLGLLLLTLAALLIRPGDIVPALANTPIYETLIVCCVLVSAFRIALPTWVVVALIQLRHWTLIPMYLLLVSNFYPAAGQVVDYWFVEVLVQLVLVLAAVFALPAARRAARRRPYGFACAALALVVALALAGPLVWDTRALYDRSPHLVFWMFALGWVLHRAPSRPAEFASLAQTTSAGFRPGTICYGKRTKGTKIPDSPGSIRQWMFPIGEK